MKEEIKNVNEQRCTEKNYRFLGQFLAVKLPTIDSKERQNRTFFEYNHRQIYSYVTVNPMARLYFYYGQNPLKNLKWSVN